jgi:hypothetical protein
VLARRRWPRGGFYDGFWGLHGCVSVFGWVVGGMLRVVGDRRVG